jgi:succinyl-CoA synthetase beta subunit
VYVCERLFPRREFYFAILVDRKAQVRRICMASEGLGAEGGTRARQGPVLVASAQGGMDIEAVAHENPSAILSEPVSITKGTEPQQRGRPNATLTMVHVRHGQG